MSEYAESVGSLTDINSADIDIIQQILNNDEIECSIDTSSESQSLDEIDLEQEQEIVQPEASEVNEEAQPLTQAMPTSAEDDEKSESRWSGMSLTTQVSKTRKLLVDGLVTILHPQFLIMMEAMRVVQNKIEISSAADLHFLSLLEKIFLAFETKLNDELEKMGLNPILKRRYWNNIGEKPWREFLLKDTSYTKFTREDMLYIADCRPFFVRWLTEMQESITSSLSQSTTHIGTSSMIANTAPTAVDVSASKKLKGNLTRREPCQKP